MLFNLRILSLKMNWCKILEPDMKIQYAVRIGAINIPEAHFLLEQKFSYRLAVSYSSPDFYPFWDEVIF